MSIDTAFSFFLKFKDVVCWIWDRFEQMKLTDDLAVEIKENLDYLQRIIKKIEPHIKNDSSNTEEIKRFYTNMEDVRKSCNNIAEKYPLTKAAITYIGELQTMRSKVKMVRENINTFIKKNQLAIICDGVESLASLHKKSDKIASLQQNNNIGIYAVLDKFLRPPTAPSELEIKESKYTFILSWKPSKEFVDYYEVCYDEQEKRLLPRDSVGKATTVMIKSPIVSAGKLYTMKVRGVNKGGKGEWSNSVVGQFAKPFPQQPEISDLLLRSTIAVVTVQIPGVVCSTEPPVTCVEVSYVSLTDTKWTNHVFEIVPGEKTTDTFTLSGLQPDTKYSFKVKTMNAEGWSEPSSLIAGNTLTLPPKPAKPDPPVIEACSPTEVTLIAKVPENTCGIKSPIIEWKVSGYGKDEEKTDCNLCEDFKIGESKFMEKTVNFNLSDMDPVRKYTLHLFAKNENEWSEPSEDFTVWIALPSSPKDVRVSSKRSHSAIKIRWKPPDFSPLKSHYEIMKKAKKAHDYDGKSIKIPAIKFSATFTKLSQNTHYCFKIRTCNGPYESGWVHIEAKTEIHKAFKAALSPAKWALSTARITRGADVESDQSDDEDAFIIED